MFVPAEVVWQAGVPAPVGGGGLPCLTLPPVHGDAHIASVVKALCTGLLTAWVRGRLSLMSKVKKSF